MVDDHNPNPEAPAKSNRRRERREQRNVGRGATARIAIKKSRYVRVIERKEVRRDEPIEYFFPTGVRNTL